MKEQTKVIPYDQLLPALLAYHTPRRIISFDIPSDGILAEIEAIKGTNHD